MLHDIFISYKCDNAGSNFGHRLYDDLSAMDFNVYFNPEDERSGDFSEQILEGVDNCKDFILILSQECLDQLRRHEKVDWVREELLAAYRADKNIIPVLMDGVTMPKDSDEMPDDLAFLPKIKAVTLPDQYSSSPFDSLLGKLRSRPVGADRYRDVVNGNPDFNMAERLAELKERAQAGDTRAMHELALSYYYGFAIEPEFRGGRDYQRAARWLRKVAASEDAELASDAHTLLARMYYQGVMPRRDQSYEKSLEHYKAAGDSSFALAQLAFMHKVGCGCKIDLDAAEQYYLKAVSLGDSVTNEGLGQFYESLGRIDDAIAAYRSMKRMTPEANYRLGMIYRDGKHCSPPHADFDLAAQHFARAAERGHTLAMRELGLLYFRPTGSFPKDFEKAQSLFEEAAAAGDAESQYMLGYMYGFGYVTRDIAKAIHYFEASAAQGNMLSVAHLGFFYQEPECLNYCQALRYAKRAADAGHADCAFMAGSMYLLGRGCEPDIDQAYIYLNKAVNRGFHQAQYLLDQIELMDEL